MALRAPTIALFGCPFCGCFFGRPQATSRVIYSIYRIEEESKRGKERKKEGRKEGRFRRSSNRFRDIESGGAAAVWQFGLFEAAATVSAASFVLPQQTTGQEFPDALRVTRKRTHDALQHIVF